jgi:hypothetical protein
MSIESRVPPKMLGFDLRNAAFPPYEMRFCRPSERLTAGKMGSKGSKTTDSRIEGINLAADAIPQQSR